MGTYTRHFVTETEWGFPDALVEAMNNLVVIEKDGVPNGRYITEIPKGPLPPLNEWYRQAVNEAKGESRGKN